MQPFIAQWYFFLKLGGSTPTPPPSGDALLWDTETTALIAENTEFLLDDGD